MTAPIRTLVADADTTARERLAALLGADHRYTVVAQAASGDDAIVAIGSERPELAFLAVDLPAVDSFGVMHAAGYATAPLVVFVSADAGHAVRAFDECSLDFLLKPVDELRLLRTLARAGAATVARRAAGDPHLARIATPPAHAAPRPHPDLLAVKVGDHSRCWSQSRNSAPRTTGATTRGRPRAPLVTPIPPLAHGSSRAGARGRYRSRRSSLQLQMFTSRGGTSWAIWHIPASKSSTARRWPPPRAATGPPSSPRSSW
jgi:CheY-like chemotaxis protein